jgi:hypothetical protein
MSGQRRILRNSALLLLLICTSNAQGSAQNYLQFKFQYNTIINNEVMRIKVTETITDSQIEIERETDTADGIIRFPTQRRLVPRDSLEKMRVRYKQCWRIFDSYSHSSSYIITSHGPVFGIYNVEPGGQSYLSFALGRLQRKQSPEVWDSLYGLVNIAQQKSHIVDVMEKFGPLIKAQKLLPYAGHTIIEDY